MAIANVPNPTSVTPHLIVRGADKAIEFYKKAFGARLIARMSAPGSDTVMHAQLEIGNGRIMLAEEFPQNPNKAPTPGAGVPVSMHLHTDDADKLFNQAVAAGATVTMPLANMFWGDRYGHLRDPFGHQWAIGQTLETLTHEEIDRRATEFFKNFKPQQAPGGCSNSPSS